MLFVSHFPFHSSGLTKHIKFFIMVFQQCCKDTPMELATKPLEPIINNVTEELNAEDNGLAASDGSGGSRGWDSKDGDGEDRSVQSTPSASGEGAEGGGSSDGGGSSEGGSSDCMQGYDEIGCKVGHGRVDLIPLPEDSPGAIIIKATNARFHGATVDDHVKVTRTIKEILTKITPENFDQQMEQLLESRINTVQILADTVSIVFDKAILEPDFCGMYADVCVHLSKELPEFPSEDGGNPMTFRRILLNTCQKEFEGASKVRKELNTVETEAEKVCATACVKGHTMGNIKLIAELFNRNIIAETIVHACITDLLGPPETEPTDETIEALCGLLDSVGKKMDASPKLPKQVINIYFARVRALSKSKNLKPCTGLLCSDTMELRKANWVPRRVKKLEEESLDEISIGGGLMYDAETVEEKITSLITGYMELADVGEAVLCIKDIQQKSIDSPGAISTLAAKLVLHVIYSAKQKSRDLVIKLLVASNQDCGVDASVIATAFSRPIGMLDYLVIDIPMARKLLGVMVAQLIIEGVLNMAHFASSAKSVVNLLYRRMYIVTVLKELKARGNAPVASYIRKGGVDLASLLSSAGDPKLINSALSSREFLEKAGLEELCLFIPFD